MSLIKLYNLEGCPFCRMVTDVLDKRQIPYHKIEVPAQRYLRAEVIAVSGQPLVPVLVDGARVFKDEDEILAYLDQAYPT